MSKTMKILGVLLVAVMLVSVATPVFAAGDTDSEGMLLPGSINAKFDSSSATALSDMAGRVVGLIRNIAVIAGVILLSVIGIKFMMGSAEEKAEYKKSLMPLVIGIVVVMSATQIMSMIFGFINPTNS